jgi:hypothetical protein
MYQPEIFSFPTASHLPDFPPSHLPTRASEFSYRNYQLQDMARLACLDGGGLFWDMGMGKTVGAFSMAAVWNTTLNLFVAPGELHEKTIEEARRLFGIEMKVLRSQADYHADPILREAACGRHPSTSEIPARAAIWYITSYTALGVNNSDEYDHHPQPVPIPIMDKRRAWAHLYRQEFLSHGIGQSKLGYVCVSEPTLASLCANVFDFVCIDEGVRLKAGPNSQQATGILTLNPKKRLVLTGTPIKNRLPDIFWLLQWGNGFSLSPQIDPNAVNPRFPYPATLQAQQEFADEFLIEEENHSASERYRKETGKRRKITKQRNQLTNIHRLWKLFAPNFVRRTKWNSGIELPTKTFQQIRVPMGTRQRDVIRYLCEFRPSFASAGHKVKALAAAGMQLNMLRTAALSPQNPDYASRFDPEETGPFPTGHECTPKLVSLCELTAEIVNKGEQLLIFSPFHMFTDSLCQRLDEMGIDYRRCDGTQSPAKRGALGTAFNNGQFPVMVAGIKSMAEGHNFDKVTNACFAGYEQAMDLNLQAIERVHRITSINSVTIYIMTTIGTIDERLAEILRDKSDAAAISLDGHISEALTEEYNEHALLRDALAAFDTSTRTIDELVLAGQPITTVTVTAKAKVPPIITSNISVTTTTAPTQSDRHNAALTYAEELRRRYNL